MYRYRENLLHFSPKVINHQRVYESDDNNKKISIQGKSKLSCNNSMDNENI